jgi:iron transport multicopper oxidase
MLLARLGGLAALASLASAKLVELHWTVDWVTAAPAGVSRAVIGINGQWPCPTITADKGDQIKVVLTNNLGNQTTGLHFHGINQVSTNYMDGPSFATQCPLAPGLTMTYAFTADEAGTYWYHSHNMGQYPDGLRGPLIVHDPADPYKGKYDEEYIVTISDWYNSESIPLVQAMFDPGNTHFLPPFPDTIVVNDGQSTDYPFVKGKTYRIRIISFAAFASAMIQFDSHTMQTIMTDASYVQQESSYQLRVAPAQRYDVLISAIDRDRRNYPFLVSLDINRDWTNEASQPPIAWPHNYTGYLVMDAAGPKPTYAVNKWGPDDDSKFGSFNLAPILPTANKIIQLDFEFCFDKFGIPRACFNGAPYIIQKVPTLYTAASVGDDNTNPAVYGPVHPFVISSGDIVDIVVNNKDAAVHPFHLHGHQFQVVKRPASGTGVWPGVKRANLNPTPPSRDTVAVMANSYAVLRFKANNPGVFLFHCHIEWHVEMGLTVTIIEAPELLKNIPIPADHIASCNALGIPTTGNAGGNTQNHTDSSNYNLDPPQTYIGATYVPPASRMRSRVVRKARGVPYKGFS